MFKRNLTTLSENETFFLWGPRQTGKTTLLKTVFSDVTQSSSGVFGLFNVA